MPITFAPLRTVRRDCGTDLTVSLRKNSKTGVCSLEMALSSAAQDRVRYIDGDRVIAHSDEANKSWVLERISADRVADGYKVQVKDLASGVATALIRLGCTNTQAWSVMGGESKSRFEFLELSGNKTTFVEAE